MINTSLTKFLTPVALGPNEFLSFRDKRTSNAFKVIKELKSKRNPVKGIEPAGNSEPLEGLSNLCGLWVEIDGLVYITWVWTGADPDGFFIEFEEGLSEVWNVIPPGGTIDGALREAVMDGGSYDPDTLIRLRITAHDGVSPVGDTLSLEDFLVIRSGDFGPVCS